MRVEEVNSTIEKLYKVFAVDIASEVRFVGCGEDKHITELACGSLIWVFELRI